MSALPPAVDEMLQLNWPYIARAIEATREMNLGTPLAYLLFDLSDPTAFQTAATINQEAIRRGSQGDHWEITAGAGYTRREPITQADFVNDLERLRAEGRCHMTSVAAEVAEALFGADKCPDDGVSFTLVVVAEGRYWAQVMKYRLIRPEDN